jgi:hypothetical protein
MKIANCKSQNSFRHLDFAFLLFPSYLLDSPLYPPATQDLLSAVENRSLTGSD